MVRKTLLVAFLSFISSKAEAALTDSEKAQIAQFIEKGAVANAARVRALVARPDLASEEAAEPLKRGFSSSSFDDARQRFADALLFGPGSAASRNAITPPLVDALLARAAARMGDIPAAPQGPLSSTERAAAEEVLAIHAFIDRNIANFGTPPPEGHDSASAIRDDAWRAAAGAEKAHREAHARWLGGGSAATPPELGHLRAQTALTLIDLARGVVGRHDVSSWLGLDGVRREAFERYGVLVESTAPDARITDALRMFEATPGSLQGMSLLLLSKTSPAGISARGSVAYIGAELGASPVPGRTEKLWAEEVKPSAPDAALSLAAGAAALLGVERAFERRPEVATQARAASGRAAATGPGGYLSAAVVGMALEGDPSAPRAPSSPEIVLSSAVRLLLLDGQRALDLAIIRAAEGRPQALEQFSTALALLAGNGNRATLGRTRDDGAVEHEVATDVKVEDGVATAFVLGGKHYVVIAAKGGAFQVIVDGSPPKLTSLGSYRERTAEGDAFKAGSVSFATLFGSPRGASLDDGRLVVDGSKGGFDALVTGAPLEDGEASAHITPKGLGGGLLLRASSGDASYVAVALLLSADPARARLLAFGGKGKAVELADSLPLPPVSDGGYAVSLETSGTTVVAKIDGRTITGTLGRNLPEGKAGVAVLAGSRIDVRDFKTRPCPTPLPPASAAKAPAASASCFRAVAKGAR